MTKLWQEALAHGKDHLFQTGRTPGIREEFERRYPNRPDWHATAKEHARFWLKARAEALREGMRRVDDCSSDALAQLAAEYERALQESEHETG